LSFQQRRFKAYCVIPSVEEKKKKNEGQPKLPVDARADMCVGMINE
jgi:hypothetical protein